VATELFEDRTARLRELTGLLKASEADLPKAVEKLSAQVKELKQRPAGESSGAEAERLVAAAEDIGGVPVVVSRADVGDAKTLLDLSLQVRQKLGEAAVVLGAAADGRVHLVANVAPEAVERGVKAGKIVGAAAKVAGGGGGGRDTMAQAGGRDPEKLDEALATARAAIESALS
jgi:alanyl-tRNA synthetase